MLLAAAVAVSFGFSFEAAAQQPKADPFQVKAVYLFNFGKFIVWPAASAKDSSFAICVLGRDPFDGFLDATLAGEKIDNRALVARRIANPREAAGCRILFISSSESAHLKEVLANIDKSGVLTVSDISGFAGSGGMIEFILKDNKVRFEVNLTAAEKAGLTLSSQLLKVATDVRKAPPGPDVKP
jgi:hypothetical protein